MVENEAAGRSSGPMAWPRNLQVAVTTLPLAVVAATFAYSIVKEGLPDTPLDWVGAAISMLFSWALLSSVLAIVVWLAVGVIKLRQLAVRRSLRKGRAVS